MIAVIVVRGGQLPAGAAEAVAECSGRAVLVGDELDTATEQLHGIATHVTRAESLAGPGANAAALASLVGEHAVIVCPASPDGRDLAPRLAARLHRPLWCNAVRVEAHRIEVMRADGTLMQRITPTPPFVATLVPGVRGTLPITDEAPVVVDVDAVTTGPADATCLGVTPPDAATIDLSEAPRILGGGAGLDGAQRFAQLTELGAVLGASVGATRVITDRHWVGHERQIGTTGVVVDPRLYVAFGVSGAVQHTAGLGAPEHVISVNTDPHCPMMQMADLALVADANATLDALLAMIEPGASCQ